MVEAVAADGHLDHAPSLPRLRAMLAGETGYLRQRRLYGKTGTLRAMLAELAAGLNT